MQRILIEEGCKEGWTDGRVKLIADFFANGGTEDDAIKMLRATPEEIQKAKNNEVSCARR